MSTESKPDSPTSDPQPPSSPEAASSSDDSFGTAPANSPDTPHKFPSTSTTETESQAEASQRPHSYTSVVSSDGSFVTANSDDSDDVTLHGSSEAEGIIEEVEAIFEEVEGDDTLLPLPSEANESLVSFIDEDHNVIENVIIPAPGVPAPGRVERDFERSRRRANNNLNELKDYNSFSLVYQRPIREDGVETIELRCRSLDDENVNLQVLTFERSYVGDGSEAFLNGMIAGRLIRTTRIKTTSWVRCGDTANTHIGIVTGPNRKDFFRRTRPIVVTMADIFPRELRFRFIPQGNFLRKLFYCYATKEYFIYNSAEERIGSIRHGREIEIQLPGIVGDNRNNNSVKGILLAASFNIYDLHFAPIFGRLDIGEMGFDCLYESVLCVLIFVPLISALIYLLFLQWQTSSKLVYG